MPSYYNNSGVFSEQAKRIKAKRKILNLSQKELSKDIGYSYSYLSKIENGRYANEWVYTKIESILDQKLRSCKKDLIEYHKNKMNEHAETIKVLESIL